MRRPSKLNAILVNKNSPESVIPIVDMPVTIGRGDDVALRIDDRWISRKHCEIDRLDDRLIVRDLGSTHGTFVNGQSIDVYELSPGDEISIGLTSFITRFGRRPHESYSAQ